MTHQQSEEACICPACVCVVADCERPRIHGRRIRVLTYRSDIADLSVIVSLCGEHAAIIDTISEGDE